MTTTRIKTHSLFGTNFIRANLFPAPGAVLGLYPQKKNRVLSPWNSIADWCERRAYSIHRLNRNAYVSETQRVILRRSQVSMPGEPAFELELQRARLKIRKDGLKSAYRFELLALVCNAIEHSVGIAPYKQQIEAALAMLDGRLVEMATGEGKTVAVFLAAGCAAIAGAPVHLVSANAYLAQRDAQQFQGACQLLGVSSAVLEQSLDRSARAAIYKHDIVYATASELVFDYLNDQLDEKRGTEKVMRGLCVAIVDEADSVLLDEARTPFVIATLRQDPELAKNLQTVLGIARLLISNFHFVLESKVRTIRLTKKGQDQIEKYAQLFLGVWKFSAEFREDLVKQALTALHVMQRDLDYIVADKEVAIVDQNTGRIAQGRRWSNGLHQLVELKEGLEPSADQGTSAQLTFQRFFPRYLHLTGTSATLAEAGSELHHLYQLFIHTIAPRVRSQRQAMGTWVFQSQNQQFRAVAADVNEKLQVGRAVLIGTDSVDQSNQLHQFLLSEIVNTKPDVIQLLNAFEHQSESALIAQAGNAGMVTVATNMAGRGTDIKLADCVKSAGGLHVISIQANSSARIDRQLAGRAGRQGDPGSVSTYLSLDSGLFKRYASRGLLGEFVRPTFRVLGPTWNRLLRAYESRKHRQYRALLVEQDLQFERQMFFGGRAE